MKKNRKVTLLL